MSPAEFFARQSNTHFFGVDVPTELTPRQAELAALFERHNFSDRTDAVRDLIETVSGVKLPPKPDRRTTFHTRSMCGSFVVTAQGVELTPQGYDNAHGPSHSRLIEKPVTAEQVQSLLPPNFEINVDELVAALGPVTMSEADTLATETHRRYGGSVEAIEELTGGRVIRNADFTVGTPVFVNTGDRYRTNVLYQIGKGPDSDGDCQLYLAGTTELVSQPPLTPYVRVSQLRKPTEEELRAFLGQNP